MTYEVIHIAGSKGKGTVAWLVAEGLQVAGKKVGLFTSPYILEREEMIRVDGEIISKDKLAELIEKTNKGGDLSEFEAITEAAFLYFEEKACDFAVLECGWGGKRDATNLAENKILTILTHIELEHTAVLGDDLTKITNEKLGICRPGVPLLTTASQEAEVMTAIENAGIKPEIAPAEELNYHHPESVGLALYALEKLGIILTLEIREALEKLVIPGRFEILNMGEHVLILDGAHTYDSIRSLEERVLTFAQDNGLPGPVWAIHTLKDKPRELWTLFPIERTVWIDLNHERASEPPNKIPTTTVDRLLQELKSQESPKLLVFAGSFRLVEAVKRVF